MPFDPGDPAGLGTIARLALRFLLVLGALTAAGVVVLRLRVIAVSAILAMMLAAGLEPVSRRLQSRNVQAGWSSAIVLGLSTAFIATVVTWAATQAWHAGGALGPAISKGASTISAWLQNGPLGLGSLDVKSLIGAIGSSSGSILQSIAGGAGTLAEVIEVVVLTLVFATYFLSRRDDYARWFTNRLHGETADRLDVAARALYRGLGAYARAIALNGIVNALLVAAILTAMGIPLAVPLASLAFVGGFLPVVGTVTAGAAAAVVALSTKGVVAAAVMVVTTAVLHHLEVYVVGPTIIGRMARFHPAGQVAALAAGFAVAGVAGLFLAGPWLTVAITVNRAVKSAEDGRVEAVARMADRTEPTTDHAPGVAAPLHT